MLAEPEDPRLLEAARSQVAAYDARFRRVVSQNEVCSVVDNLAQASAFGGKDATGVEAVHDVVPTESKVFAGLVERAVACSQRVGCKRKRGTDPAAVTALDFGCGDGRYLFQFLRTAAHLSKAWGCGLEVTAYDVSLVALHSFRRRALHCGLQAVVSSHHGQRSQRSPRSQLARTQEELEQAQLAPSRVEGSGLSLRFLHGDVKLTAVEVVDLLAPRDGNPYDVLVFGWGTLSSIPVLPGFCADSLLAELAPLVRHMMNVVSTRNNHVKFQLQYSALRQAHEETNNEAAREWLGRRIALAMPAGSYYYPVESGEKMFYSAITAKQELERLRCAGFLCPRVLICNIVNFHDIHTKPRVARLNGAVICLLERGDIWAAQLLLAKGVAKYLRRPLSSFRTSPACVFHGQTQLAVREQVARYFISVAESSVCRKLQNAA